MVRTKADSVPASYRKGTVTIYRQLLWIQPLNVSLLKNTTGLIWSLAGRRTDTQVRLKRRYLSPGLFVNVNFMCFKIALTLVCDRRRLLLVCSGLVRSAIDSLPPTRSCPLGSSTNILKKQIKVVLHPQYWLQLRFVICHTRGHFTRTFLKFMCILLQTGASFERLSAALCECCTRLYWTVKLFYILLLLLEDTCVTGQYILNVLAEFYLLCNSANRSRLKLLNTWCLKSRFDAVVHGILVLCRPLSNCSLSLLLYTLPPQVEVTCLVSIWLPVFILVFVSVCSCCSCSSQEVSGLQFSQRVLQQSVHHAGSVWLHSQYEHTHTWPDSLRMFVIHS